MQQLETFVTIQIPDRYVLVEKTELVELQEQAGKVVGNMKWLMEEVHIKSPSTIKEKLLYPFREELEPFVSYPSADNGHWKFNITPMRKWLRQNHKRVWG